MQKHFLEDIISWDIRSWSSALYYWEENVQWDNVQKCLELGARSGGLSLWLALKNKQVICSDVKNTRNNAGKLHKAYEVESLVSYQDIDATDIPYRDYFDLIIFKSIIGAIGANNNYSMQRKAFQEIHKALKKGGYLLFAENLVGSPLHMLLRKWFVPWGNYWRYITIAEIKDFLRDFFYYQTRTTGFLAAFGRNEAQRTTLSILDKKMFNKLCPDRWKYIGYGIAIK